MKPLIPSLLLTIPLLAQAPMTQPIWQRANDAFLNADLDELRRLQADLAATKVEATQDKWRQYLTVYTSARIIQRLPSKDRKALLEDALALLEKLDFPEAVALKANLYAMKIPQNPMVYGPVLGIKAGNQLDKADKESPDNPRVLFYKASSTFFRPSMFGGSKEKGLALMLKTLELFQKEKLSRDPWTLTWGLTETHAKLVEMYSSLKQWAEAHKHLDEVASRAPEHGKRLAEWLAGKEKEGRESK